VDFDFVGVAVAVAVGPIPTCAITPNLWPAVVGSFGSHSRTGSAVAGHHPLWQTQVLPPMLRQGCQPQ